MAAVKKWCDSKNILLDWSGIAPSPSKDFCQVLVTIDKVIYRCWKISLRNDAKITPSEIVLHYKDFLDDYKVQSDIRRVFSENILNHIILLANGQIDYLPRLPKHLLVHIIKFLPLEDINNIAQASRLFNTVCRSEDLWRAVYLQHSGPNISRDLYSLADRNGWKKLFFTNKLQLQVQLRRQAKRRTAETDDPDDSRSQQTPSPFFVSQTPYERDALSPCQSITTSLPPLSDVTSLRHITFLGDGKQSPSTVYSPTGTPDLSQRIGDNRIEPEDDDVVSSHSGHGDGQNVYNLRAQ